MRYMTFARLCSSIGYLNSLSVYDKYDLMKCGYRMKRVVCMSLLYDVIKVSTEVASPVVIS